MFLNRWEAAVFVKENRDRRKYIYICIHTACTYTYIYILTFKYINTYSHITHSSTCTDRQADRQTEKLIYTYTYAYHICTDKYMHIHSQELQPQTLVIQIKTLLFENLNSRSHLRIIRKLITL